jgi:uncharacterized protein
MKDFDPTKHLIFEGITGSKLYGTNTPESDTDRRGVCTPPMDVLLNPFMPFEQKDSGFEEEDRVIYALGKFFALCADCNPNIVELLFVPENMILFNSPEWELVQENKHLFLSKKAKYTFTGYAFSQLNAIKTHRQWFIDPPKKKPERKDFGLKEVPLVTGDNLDHALNIPHDLFKDEFREELMNEREYRIQKKKWDNYVAWRDNRNQKRREMEDKFGYDCKHASHLIRLMTEGKELLLTGNITFPLENSDEIRAIKNGKYSYDEILGIAENMDREFDTWYESSTLPKAPDRNKLLDLYIEIIG